MLTSELKYWKYCHFLLNFKNIYILDIKYERNLQIHIKFIRQHLRLELLRNSEMFFFSYGHLKNFHKRTCKLKGWCLTMLIFWAVLMMDYRKFTSGSYVINEFELRIENGVRRTLSATPSFSSPKVTSFASATPLTNNKERWYLYPFVGESFLVKRTEHGIGKWCKKKKIKRKKKKKEVPLLQL